MGGGGWSISLRTRASFCRCSTSACRAPSTSASALPRALATFWRPLQRLRSCETDFSASESRALVPPSSVSSEEILPFCSLTTSCSTLHDFARFTLLPWNSLSLSRRSPSSADTLETLARSAVASSPDRSTAAACWSTWLWARPSRRECSSSLTISSSLSCFASSAIFLNSSTLVSSSLMRGSSTSGSGASRSSQLGSTLWSLACAAVTRLARSLPAPAPERSLPAPASSARVLRRSSCVAWRCASSVRAAVAAD
mmetsp:Transcript_17358/g.41817  ORF Transcript_17358/g.41817 Transcript_17358/m.41817 type:complete len:255 (-) Transcript_17358:245-1009(-)